MGAASVYEHKALTGAALTEYPAELASSDTRPVDLAQTTEKPGVRSSSTRLESRDPARSEESAIDWAASTRSMIHFTAVGGT
jgi:hypothetical protein